MFQYLTHTKLQKNERINIMFLQKNERILSTLNAY